MSAEKPKGEDEKTTACGGIERMFEMMSRCCEGGGSLRDCYSMMSLIEKCCGPRAENRGEQG